MVETRDEQITTNKIDDTNDGGSGPKLGDLFIESLSVSREVRRVKITGWKSNVKVTILIKTSR